jgi:hypothetical protein
LDPAEVKQLNAVCAAALTMADKWLGEFLGRFREPGLGLDGRPFLSDHGLLLGERGWTAGRRDLPRRADRRLTDVCWGPWTSPGSVHPLETHERLETHALASRAPSPSAATWPSGSIAVTATAIMALCCWDIFTSWGLTAVVAAALLAHARPRGGRHDTDQYRLPDFSGPGPDLLYVSLGADFVDGGSGADTIAPRPPRPRSSVARGPT